MSGNKPEQKHDDERLQENAQLVEDIKLFGEFLDPQQANVVLTPARKAALRRILLAASLFVESQEVRPSAPEAEKPEGST
jgi:hypothetical protein